MGSRLNQCTRLAVCHLKSHSLLDHVALFTSCRNDLDAQSGLVVGLLVSEFGLISVKSAGSDEPILKCMSGISLTTIQVACIPEMTSC